MALKVVIVARANADLGAIRDFLTSRNHAVALAVAAELLQAFARIGYYPRIGRETDIPGVYVTTLARYPYRIYYNIGSQQIVILHIRHTSRAMMQGSRRGVGISP